MVTDMNQTERKINELPSKTWYWLKMNDTVLPWGEDGGQVFIRPDENRNPAFMTLSGRDYEKKIIEITAKPGKQTAVYINCGEFTHLETEMHIQVENNACLKLVQIFSMREDSVLMNRIHASVAEKGKFELYQIAPGEGDLYLETIVDLLGKKAEFTADLGYLTRDCHKLDINMVVNHYGEESKSLIRTDGALQDDAKKIFRGTIDFKQGSANSEGEETEKVLMLSENAQNQTIPVILCHEETVSGSHGASIGEPDEDTYFYFASRGIGKEATDKILSEAAILRVKSLISTEQAAEWLRDSLQEGMREE